MIKNNKMKKKESKLLGAWTFRNEQTEWMNEMVRKPEAIVHIRVYWTIGFTLQVYIMLKCNFVQKFLFLFGILAMPTMNNVNQGPFHYSSGHFILLVFLVLRRGSICNCALVLFTKILNDLIIVCVWSWAICFRIMELHYEQRFS